MLSAQKEIALVQSVSRFNADISRRHTAFLNKDILKTLATCDQKCRQNRKVDLGFNLFAIISDVYYRECLHSDLLKSYLDPYEKHCYGDFFLRRFLNYLRQRGVPVKDNDYANAKVIREEGRIDILIRDDVSRKSIIIENKINGAGDMDHQLVRYLDDVTSRGYTCESIIYLCLNRHKVPETVGWSVAERQRVRDRLTVICAYDETANDLLNGWIKPCLDAAKPVATAPCANSTQLDALFILRQYGTLITKLGVNVMNKPIMEDFFNFIVKDDNWKTAVSLKSMLNDLILFRTERIIDTFRQAPAPFTSVGNWKDYDAVFMGYIAGDAHFGIDVSSSDDSYTVVFWDRNDATGVKGLAKIRLGQIGVLSELQESPGRFARSFAFPSQDQELYEFLRHLKAKLQEPIVG